MSTPLQTGESINIITSPNAHPNPAWLNFIVTAKARSNIRNYLRNQQAEEAIILGRRLLNKDLHAFTEQLDNIPTERIDELLAELQLDNFDALLRDIGLGKQASLSIAQKLVIDSAPDKEQQALVIAGSEGLVVSFGRCCHPLPGDPILGYASVGRGIIIHRQDCKTIVNMRGQHEKWLEVAWAGEIARDFQVDILLHCKNQKGVLATIASVMSGAESNIDNVVMEERDGGYTDMHLTIEVKDRQHLARVIRRLRVLDIVERITRV